MTADLIVTPKIEASWKKALGQEFSAPYFRTIKEKILAEKAAGNVLYPPGPYIFRAFDLTPFDRVKVVILGQDPYHSKGQAHGLSFSVPNGIKPPPSLVNIYKEIESDLGVSLDKTNGNLEHWAEQGVLLLNALLTVRAGEPASHHHIGWKTFTDAVIKTLSDKRECIVFMLWGKFAQEKASLIDASKHLILTSAHPSPYSASNGFFGSKHFSKTNAYLKAHAIEPIDWAYKD